MVHPFTENAVAINALARSYLRVRFTGGPVPHCTSQVAPPQPSPLDAAVLAYNSLAMLRQQIQPSWLIHCIVSDGGKHPDVWPALAELLCYFRAPTHTELEALQSKARACFEAAAEATECSLAVTEKARTYMDVISNPTLSQLFLKNTRLLGLGFSETTQNFSASTDMGNVSHIVPSIHPVYSIGSTAVNHTRAFTEAANTEVAHAATLQAAKSLALTVVDLLSSPQLVAQVRADFQHQTVQM